MSFSKQAIQAQCDSGAWHYDAYVRLFQALGMRIGDYRSRAEELRCGEEDERPSPEASTPTDPESH